MLKCGKGLVEVGVTGEEGDFRISDVTDPVRKPGTGVRKIRR